MSVFCVNAFAVQHAGKPNIVAEFRFAGYLCERFDTFHRSTYGMHGNIVSFFVYFALVCFKCI